MKFTNSIAIVSCHPLGEAEKERSRSTEREMIAAVVMFTANLHTLPHDVGTDAIQLGRVNIKPELANAVHLCAIDFDIDENERDAGTGGERERGTAAREPENGEPQTKTKTAGEAS